MSLPDVVLDYEVLADDIAAKVKLDGEHLVLLAESFSGPLAVLLATRLDVQALVLVARIKPPLLLIQFLLTGGDRR
ncbi:MAG: hypothetical protein ABGY95_10590 [Rubritalea sp.]|uniref:hypothetical protein n=1 Tax=Rubritalea sp. TaxID=2109375 RepID=UPI0032424FC9